MPPQHNPSTEARHCWKPRDRARRQARRAIRQRVGEAAGGVLRRGEAPRRHVVVETKEVIQQLLQRIIDNDRSFFSLKNLQETQSLLSSPIPTGLLWDDDDALWGADKLLSWHGVEGVEKLELFLRDRDTIMPMEYAVIFQRYHIVGSLLLGGINPCLRGSLKGYGQDEEGEGALHDLGTLLLQRFFEPIPLTLSGYIAKRSFDARYAAWRETNHDEPCSRCSRSIPPSSRLSFSPECDHMICETCFWEHTLQRLDQSEGDIVACPACCRDQSSDALPDGTSPPVDANTCRQRFENTQKQFYQLPKNREELLRSDRKKAKKNGRFILSSTWSEAVVPFLGVSQETRTDRFFNFVEAGSFYQVRGCLDAGIDIGLSNQYGQTALYSAAWRGHSRIVRILLEHGADPLASANEGSYPMDAARASGYSPIVELLEQYGGAHCCGVGTGSLSLPNRPLGLQVLIPLAEDHSGAGSYSIDGILDEATAEALVGLWSGLPMADSKKKAGPCSERRYFCDVRGWIVSLLRRAVLSVAETDEGVVVLPFMRFLCYKESGTILAPHVDLARVDLETGRRSTHTFLLYVTECVHGGATTLLESLSGDGRNQKLARVMPKRGRLLLFPHACPHEGEEVVDTPKLLVRGEVILPGGTLRD
jgi:hypothetical protein